MESVGIRELKAHLSAYVKRARAGERIIVLERGREVAEFIPLGPERAALQRMAAEGRVTWGGGKPQGRRGIETRGKSLSETLLEDWRRSSTSIPAAS